MMRVLKTLQSFFKKGYIFFIFIFSIGQILFAQEGNVKIHYLGHSAFVMQFDNGVNIVCDYGHYNAWVQWGWDSPIHDIGDLVPDIMTYSHHHEDHYDPDRIPEGVSYILTGMDSLEYEGISIKPIRTCEDNINIESNTSYLFSYKNLKILHLGDAQAQIENITNLEVRLHILKIIPDSLDMLFMTIEGKTQFIPEAEKFVSLLSPKRIIPMHHWSETYLDSFIAELEKQNLSGKTYQITRYASTEYELLGAEEVTPTKVITLQRGPFPITHIEIKPEHLRLFRLYQNFPNPFNPVTIINYELPITNDVKLSVYNVLGQRVRALVDRRQEAGKYEVVFNAHGLSSGVYYYKLQTNTGYLQVNKMALIR